MSTPPFEIFHLPFEIQKRNGKRQLAKSKRQMVFSESFQMTNMTNGKTGFSSPFEICRLPSPILKFPFRQALPYTRQERQ
jgi:hypothetical protein